MEDSTVKYEKFISSEEKSKKSAKTFNTVCALLVVFATLLAATVIAVGIGVGVSMPGKVAESVQVYTLTEGELQGLYYGANGGIYFHSKINSSHIYFLVTTTDGREIVLIIRPLNTSMTMMEINKMDFLFMENQNGPDLYTEYLIPTNYMDTMMDIMTGERNMSDEVLGQLDNKTVIETRRSYLTNLAKSPEAQLIIEAAEALGKLGIHGDDSSAAMKFYQFAMKLASARYFEKTISSDSGKRNVIIRSKRRDVCVNPHVPPNTKCSSGRCPYRAEGNNCFGMCGYGCNCWSWVCKDCCVHTFCETHDQCCADENFVSGACFAVIYRKPFSSCSDVYRCEF